MTALDRQNEGAADNDRQPKPWDQLPAEPLDCYYWFRLFLALPIPRQVAKVAKLIGTNSPKTWISKIARRWRWKERAAALDAERAEQLIVRAELREQLLLDKAFEAQFQGLVDTTKALENAQIGDMNRDEARTYLTPLSRHQRGLLQIVLRQKEETARKGLEELNEIRLALLIEERALQRVEEMEKERDEMLAKIYGAYSEQE